MSISLKADPSGTFGEILVNGAVVAKLPLTGNAVIPGLVGTVSQSGGVPTGAVVERGSNANGDYVRFADGTQICTGRTSAGPATTAQGQVFMSSDLTWSFPATFAQPPAIAGTVDGAGVWTVSGTQPTTLLGSLRYAAGVAVPSSNTLTALAVGRWF